MLLATEQNRVGRKLTTSVDWWNIFKGFLLIIHLTVFLTNLHNVMIKDPENVEPDLTSWCSLWK